MAPGLCFLHLGICKILLTFVATQFELSPPPGDAVSATVFAPESNKLLVASWDKNVYNYDIGNGSGDAKLINTYEHRAPVLDVCFGDNDEEAFTAGMDCAVNRLVCRGKPNQIQFIYDTND